MTRPLEQAYQCGRLSANLALRPGGDELTSHLLRAAGFTAGQRILDLGCGDGAGLGHLGRLGCIPVGIDLAHASLAAQDQPNKLVTADARHMPFGSACFDGVLAECALSLTAYSAAALGECARVLRPAGRLAITDIFSQQATTDSDELPGCLKGIRPLPDILEAITAAGLSILQLEDHSAVLKRLLAQLIFSGQCAELLDGATASTFASALRACRPGYFLLIGTPTPGRH